jgi:hypothetical protein
MNQNAYSQLCLITLGLLIAGALLAAPALALKVEGARIALDVEPGTTYRSPIAISIKPEESEGDFAIDVMGFGQLPADGTYTGLAAAQDTGQYSARSFITIDKPTVHLKPGERAEVTASITVPSGTTNGGRYAIILVHPAASSSGAPAAFATAVAIPVFLTVKGGTISETGVVSALEPIAADPGKPFEVSTTFQNTGNYHTYGAVVNVTITDAQGNVVASVKTEPFSRAIVPGQSVKFTNSIGTGLAAGNYLVTVRMEKQDGGLLAEKKVPLQAGSPAAAGGTQADAQATPHQSAPGFGAPAAIGGMVCAVYGILWSRRREKG